MFLISQNRYP